MNPAKYATLMCSVSFVASCVAAADDPEAETTSVQTSELRRATPPAPNDEGAAQTVSTNGAIRADSRFFQSLGENGRTCGSCHEPGNGWAISRDGVNERFDTSDGTDPIFRTNDGANSPNADVSTVEARRVAYSMLLDHGVIRVGRPIPEGAEFTLSAVDDPYGFASAQELSLFRRPLPTMNLRFITDVMWDGRETIRPYDISFDLAHQANDATRGHAQGLVDLSRRQAANIVEFESGLFTAQIESNDAGQLDARGARGGPAFLSHLPFMRGMSRPGHTFQIFDAWTKLPGTSPQTLARKAIARGQELFNTRTFNIVNVAGIRDQVGTCATCHDTPDVGGHSSPMFINLGLADGDRRPPDMPLYTLHNTATNQTIQTTDPGLALSTGKWADIGRFKVPNLRGIETRSPYFHNGVIDTIEGLVGFYNARFAIGLTADEKADLAAFIKAL